MERIESVISGKVQGVGFRYSVLKASKNFKINGFVKNLETGEVQVISEGEKQELENFLNTVRNFSFTEITEVKTKWKKFQDEFKKFEIRH